MSSTDKALQTQIKNIETSTGKSLSDLSRFINESPLTRHSQLRDMVREEFNLGYGDANLLVHLAKQPLEETADGSVDPIEAAANAIYSGNKADLRPLHDAVMNRIQQLGAFEIAPKKSNFSLRRKKQFALVGPASRGRVEVGLNMKDVEGTARLESQKPGGMCQYKVYLSQPDDVDEELMAWIKIAYDSAG